MKPQPYKPLRNSKVSIPLNHKEREDLERKASTLNMSLSSFIRLALLLFDPSAIKKK